MTFDLAMTKRQDRTSVDDHFFLISAAPPTTPPTFFLATLECKVKLFVLCFGPRFGPYLM